MIVEAMVRWTEMRIKQNDEGEAQLKRLLNGENESGFTPEFYHDYSPMTFDMDDVARFNRSADRKSTTVRFKDGDAYIMNLTYEEFQALFSQCTKKDVHTVVTDEQKNYTPKGGNSIDPTLGVSGIDGDDFGSI